MGEPTFFVEPSLFRAWLEENHAIARELVVGFYKKGSGRPSMTWPESVDQALCFGWIDGVRKGIDEETYSIRFTPRKPRNVWSAVNIARVAELTTMGLMRSAGLKAFEERLEERSVVYSYEQDAAALDERLEQEFRTVPRAWAFFQGQAPWYRKAAIWWVISAKKEATRRKRLATLIEDSEAGRPLAHLSRKPT